MSIDLNTFENLPGDELARLVEEKGPLVVTFPINGTRRWYLLKAMAGEIDADTDTYLHVMERRHIDLYRLFFDHGIHTLLTPIFGPDLLKRGEDYIRLAIEGIRRLTSEAHFLEFFEAYQVRVRFYGDYRRHLAGTTSEELISHLDHITEKTRAHNRNRLFFGMFANDASEQIADIAVRYFQHHGHTPNRRTLVSSYYGEYVEPVSFFIGFDRLSAFDMPLLATGEEDLYFTVNPSLDMTPRQLRQILYDHLYTRRAPEPDYEALSPRDLGWMQAFYKENYERTVGIGELIGGIWYPQPGAIWRSGTIQKAEEIDE